MRKCFIFFKKLIKNAHESLQNKNSIANMQNFILNSINSSRNLYNPLKSIKYKISPN